jgi:hypothetical protein
MPEMSRPSPFGKYILLPATFNVPAVGAQPCRVLKHRPGLLKDLQAQQGRGLGNDETTDRAAAILQRLGPVRWPLRLRRY